MTVHAVWPGLACLALMLLLARLPVMAVADASDIADPRRRNVPLDGLRGLLALCVFLHHAVITHHYLRDGVWRVPPSDFYGLIGPFGVAMFFMITGYLFWLKMLEEEGQPDWLRLYVGRVFRIGPLFLLAVSGVLAGVWLATGGELRVPPRQLARQVVSWLALGVISLEEVEINGYAGTQLLTAGVTWSLYWEWQFYLALPFLAMAARFPRLHLPFVVLLFAALALALALGVGQYTSWALLFASGLLCAALRRAGLLPRLDDRLASAAAAAIVVLVFALFGSAYRLEPILLLTIPFALICNGCTLFGLLTSRPALRLGHVSYGIYLLQGFALMAVFWWPAAAAFQAADPRHFWLLCLACAALLVAMATLAHVLVERPGIALGRALLRRLPEARAHRGRAPASSPAAVSTRDWRLAGGPS